MKSFRADDHQKCDRRSLVELVNNPDVQRILSSDFDYIDALDTIIDGLESSIIKQAQQHNRKHFKPLQTIPGCGPNTALTVLYEERDFGSQSPLRRDFRYMFGTAVIRRYP